MLVIFEVCEGILKARECLVKVTLFNLNLAQYHQALGFKQRELPLLFVGVFLTACHGPSLNQEQDPLRGIHEPCSEAIASP